MRKFKFVVEKTPTGFSAYSELYPVYTTGVNISELSNNAIQALNFYFKESRRKIKVAKSNLYLIG